MSTAFVMAVRVCLLILAATGWSHPADGVRVLAFSSVAARSHWNFMSGVLRALVDGGHQVTVYTQFPGRGPPVNPNYTEVDTEKDYKHVFGVALNATEVLPLFSDPLILIPFMANGSLFTCGVMDRLLDGRSGDDFDVFITEPMSDECVSHAARRLGVPLVYTIPAPLLPWIEAGAFGHLGHPAYVPHVQLAHSTVDTFYRRLSNVALTLHTTYLNYRHLYGQSLYHVPPVKPSLVFVNTHYITEPIRPVPVNRVDVGGVHLKKPKPLPAVSTSLSKRNTNCYLSSSCMVRSPFGA